VKKPPFRYSDSGYASYVGAQATRAGTVYAGANDGMLHAFDATTGAERWAYIPRMLHSELYKLADAAYAQNHRYYVDGVITVGDAFDGTNWHTILIAGLGAGGNGYFALDITDPTNPLVLWEYTNANLGKTFGNPILTKRNSDDSWVVLFASGYNNSAGDSKGRLFMVDAFTGADIGSIATTGGTDPNLSGISKITNWVLDTMVDNTTQYVYGGDLSGNLWRFDIDALAVQKLGQTSATAGARPITARPEVSRIRDSVGTYHRVVYVGTGRYMGATDVSGASTPETTSQLLLAVKDTGADLGTLTASGAALVQQTVDTSVTPRTIPTPQAVNWVSKNGWYVNIPTGERVTIEPRLQLGTVSFVANRPVDDYCALGGSSWLYALDYKTGGAITTQADNVVGISVDSKTIGTGLTIVRLPNGLLIAIVNTPDGTRTMRLPIDAAGAGSVRRVGYREIN
jgi:type IV pilus assembly protein PilY1